MKGTVAACISLSGLLLAASADPAAADGHPGLRLGVTNAPDTVFLGGFYEVPVAWAGSGFFALEPGADLGFAFNDNRDFFTIRGTLNGKYLVPVGSNVLLYPILGFSVYYVNYDCPNDNDCDRTFLGLNLGAGLRVQRINLELTAGIDDLPDVTFSVGFLF